MLDFKSVHKYKTYISSYKNKSIFNDASKGILTKSIITLSDDDLIAIQKSWDEAEQFNTNAKQHNKTLEETITKQIEEFFSDLGMPTWAKNNAGTVIGMHAEFKTMMNQMHIMFGGKECPHRPQLISVHSMGECIKPLVKVSNLLEFVNEVKPLIAEQERKKQEAAESHDKNRKMMADAILSYTKSRSDIEKSRREWVKANYPSGTVIKIAECNYCDSWRFGAFKCSCGRTYMNFKVIGDPGAWELKIWGEPDPIMNYKI
jgi:hypothetical protein